MLYRLSLCALWLALAIASPLLAAPRSSGAELNLDLRRELLRMSRDDQEARKALLEAPGDAPLQERITALDRRHVSRLKEIVKRHGWPRRSLVGEDGAGAAWLLIQHADTDRAFQKRCLTLMAPLLAKDEVRKPDFAYLTDRVLVADGKKQRYGTQFQLKDGRLEAYPLEDPDRVDERRKTVDLGPLAEFRKELEALHTPPSPAAK
jgi:hypothetical protein